MDGKTQKENSQERKSQILGENIKKYKQEVVRVLVSSVRNLQLKNFLQLETFDVSSRSKFWYGDIWARVGAD